MIGPTLKEHLPELRAEAESMFDTTCDIDRLTSRWDPVLKKSVTDWAPVHSEVPCTLRVPPVPVRSVQSDEVVTAASPQVKVSVDVLGVKPDDRITVGDKVMWVTDAPEYSHQVVRRIECRWAK